MPGPNYGALGTSFLAVRGLQMVCLIGIIGMTANFISEMVQSQNTPPNVLVGTLSVTCIAVLYCFITSLLYWDNILPFLISTAVDGLLLIAVIVVAVTVGKPLSYMDCFVIGKQTGNVKSTYAFSANMGHYLNTVGGKINYYTWLGATKGTCLQMKAVWGLSIALCILFAFSGIVGVCLWRRTKAAAEAPKSIEA
ncbi:MAG: hypothetical protein M1823_002267 [Watsoniomyces obsoletus]|nr:MAG: hypothetical protein M1823_002267 [Watsoniomyces obsoletus]